MESNNTENIDNGNSCKKVWETPQITVISPVVTSTKGGGGLTFGETTYDNPSA